MTQDDRALRLSIVEAVHAKEMTETEAWQDLNALSTNTMVDTVETFNDEIRIEDNMFSGPLLWYVILRYGNDEESDQLVSSESFPGSFEGHVANGTPIIDRMVVDVSSFYE